MVSLSQVKAGIGDYIQKAMMPRMDSKRKFLLGTAYVLISTKFDQILPALAEIPMVKMLGIIDQAGNVDIDTIYNAAKEQIQNQEYIEVSLNPLGNFKFGATDIDELYRYITNGGMTT